MKKDTRINADDVAKRTMAGVGLSHEKKPGYAFIGYDTMGRSVYSNDKLSKSVTETVGKDKVGFITGMLKSIGVADETDSKTLEHIGSVASNPKFLSQLYKLKSEGKTKEFINLIAQTLKTPAMQKFDDPQNKGGVKAGFQAFSLFSNWDNMSRAQRSLGIAQLGLDTYQFADGTDFSNKRVFEPIQKDGKTIIPGLTVGQTLGLASQGVNVYETVKNWKDLTALAKVTNGAQSVATIVNTAQTLGMYGNQKSDVNSPNLVNAPKGTVPAGGFSALGTYANTGVAGLQLASTVGNVVNTFTDENATAEQKRKAAIYGTQGVVNSLAKLGNGTAQDVAPYVNGVAAGKRLYDVYNDPNATDKQKAEAVAMATKEGVNIASQLGSSTAGEAVPYVNYAMAAYNTSKILSGNGTPEDKAKALRRTGEDTAAAYFTFGISAVAQSIDRQFLGGQSDKIRTKLDKLDPAKVATDYVTGKVIGAVTGGKNAPQQGRDAVRAHLKNIGMYGDDYQIDLPDGSIGNLGVDGHGGQHTFTYKDKTVAGTKHDKLSAYDVDYTNDMDYAASMGGTTLARLTTGGAAKNIDQIGGQLGNTSLGKVGYGAEFNQDNFNSVMQNQRAMYAKAGIKDRETFNERLENLKKNNKISAAEYAVAQQSGEMLYGDKGYDLAKNLMQGRWAGIQTVAELSEAKAASPVNFKGAKQPAEVVQ